jgi:hypothetical protein
MAQRTTNHKGQTAADVRAERLAAARVMLRAMAIAIDGMAAEDAPAGGWHWGHAGDAGAILEAVEHANGRTSMRETV